MFSCLATLALIIAVPFLILMGIGGWLLRAPTSGDYESHRQALKNARERPFRAVQARIAEGRARLREERARERRRERTKECELMLRLFRRAPGQHSG